MTCSIVFISFFMNGGGRMCHGMCVEVSRSLFFHFYTAPKVDLRFSGLQGKYLYILNPPSMYLVHQVIGTIHSLEKNTLHCNVHVEKNTQKGVWP